MFVLWWFFQRTFIELLLCARYCFTPPPPTLPHTPDTPSQVWEAQNIDTQGCETDELAIDTWIVNYRNSLILGTLLHRGILDDRCQNLAESPIKSVKFCWTLSNSFMLEKVTFLPSVFQRRRKFFISHFYFGTFSLPKDSTPLPCSLLPSLFPIFSEDKLLHFFLVCLIFAYLVCVKPGD